MSTGPNGLLQPKSSGCGGGILDFQLDPDTAVPIVLPQAACGMELPVRPSYGKGYTFTGRCEVDA